MLAWWIGDTVLARMNLPWGMPFSSPLRSIPSRLDHLSESLTGSSIGPARGMGLFVFDDGCNSLIKRPG